MPQFLTIFCLKSDLLLHCTLLGITMMLPPSLLPPTSWLVLQLTKWALYAASSYVQHN